MENEIYNLTLQTSIGQGDSDRHLLTLFSIVLGGEYKNNLELGVRNGDTTIPLFRSTFINGGLLTSIDLNECLIAKDKIEKLEQSYGAEPNQHWKFHQSDAIKFLENYQGSPFDLVYIDDWHSYSHVKRELELLDGLVTPKSVILIHDLMYGNTAPYYHSDLTLKDGQWAEGGPYRAVAELNPQFWEFSTLPYNNGLTILRKKYSSLYR